MEFSSLSCLAAHSSCLSLCCSLSSCFLSLSLSSSSYFCWSIIAFSSTFHSSTSMGLTPLSVVLISSASLSERISSSTKTVPINSLITAQEVTDVIMLCKKEQIHLSTFILHLPFRLFHKCFQLKVHGFIIYKLVCLYNFQK